MDKLKKLLFSMDKISTYSKVLLLYGIISSVIMLLFGIYFLIVCYNNFDFFVMKRAITCGVKAAQTFVTGTGCAFVTDMFLRR